MKARKVAGRARGKTSRGLLPCAAVTAFAVILLLKAFPPNNLPPAYGQAMATATVKIWDVTSTVGFHPHEIVEDIEGITDQVATPENPLTIVSTVDDTTHPGGPCGIIYFNPVTNFFKWVGVGFGFTAGIDVDKKRGNVWVTISGGSSLFYVNFQGSNRFRFYPGFSTWGIEVEEETGKVWVCRDDGFISRLDPATNALESWNAGGRPRYIVQDKDGRVYVTVESTGEIGDSILRIDPKTNELRRWLVPGGGLNVGFRNAPNGITIDAEGNVWFTETASDEIGRLNPTTNDITEFKKDALSGPSLLATSGSGSRLQVFFTEDTGGAISILSAADARGTSSTVTPTIEIVAPTPSTVTPEDRTEEFLTATVEPKVITVEGKDPNGITRFPIPDASAPAGITGVVRSTIVYADDRDGNKIYELSSGAVLARPPVIKTPVRGTVFTVDAGGTLTFDVLVEDEDSPTVTFSVTGLPTGASFPIPTPANPISTTFTWTPKPEDAGDHFVIITATDSDGLVDSVVVQITVRAAAPMALEALKFFTDGRGVKLPVEEGKPVVQVLLKKGKVKTTDPPEVIAWLFAKNKSTAPVKSVLINDTLPVNWGFRAVDAHDIALFVVDGKGRFRHIEDANEEAIFFVQAERGNGDAKPGMVDVIIPDVAKLAGKDLLADEEIVLAVKLRYLLIGTKQSAGKFPITYTNRAEVKFFSAADFGGGVADGSADASFQAKAVVKGRKRSASARIFGR